MALRMAIHDRRIWPLVGLAALSCGMFLIRLRQYKRKQIGRVSSIDESTDRTDFRGKEREIIISEGISSAIAAMERSCAKHSNYKVGACLTALDESSAAVRSYTGINVESDTYGLTVCAERVALFKALSEGEGHRHYQRINAKVENENSRKSHFQHLAVATRDGGISCGACRQLLVEYCPSNMPVDFTDDTGRVIRSTTVGQMIPDPFVLT